MSRESSSGKRFFALLVVAALLIGGYYFLFSGGSDDEVNTNTTNTQSTNIVNTTNQDGGTGGPEVPTSYDECVDAGYPIQESYPQKCSVPGGETYTQDIGNELEVDDRIQITKPRPTSTISDPLTVTGKAVGSWYFEASFPVILLDADGAELVRTIATAQGDWMTTAFVPFTATVNIPDSYSGPATLLLKKDNPSGLTENDAALRVPVVVE